MRDLPSTLVEALKARAVIPFVGAGVSRAVTDEAGQPLFPTWRGLLVAAAERLRADGLTTKANRVKAALEDDVYLDAARRARDALGALWFDFLKEQFDPPAERVRPASLDVARSVWRLGSPLVVTTNYDKVLRWASPQERDLRHWTVSDRAHLAEIHRGRLLRPAIWHLHGFIDRAEEIILTPDGYRKLYPIDGQVEADYQTALWTLRPLLTARTFLFIGFGMEKAIEQQIRWVRETFTGAGVEHFIFWFVPKTGMLWRRNCEGYPCSRSLLRISDSRCSTCSVSWPFMPNPAACGPLRRCPERRPIPGPISNTCATTRPSLRFAGCG